MALVRVWSADQNEVRAKSAPLRFVAHLCNNRTIQPRSAFSDAGFDERQAEAAAAVVREAVGAEQGQLAGTSQNPLQGAEGLWKPLN